MLIVVVALAGVVAPVWAAPPRSASAAPVQPAVRTGSTTPTSAVSRASARSLRQPSKRQPTAPRTRPADAARTSGAAATAAPQARLFKINARLYLTDKSAQREGCSGWSQLRWSETNLAAKLEYKDYHLLRLENAAIPRNDSCRVRLRRQGSVSITPLHEDAGRITARITWEVPGDDSWETDVALVPGRRSMVGSPSTFDGDAYLLSVTVR